MHKGKIVEHTTTDKLSTAPQLSDNAVANVPPHRARALQLGIWSADYRGRIQDSRVFMVISALLVLPDLVLGLLLLLFAVRTGWFPTSGLLSIQAETLSPLSKLGDIASHLALPVLLLAVSAERGQLHGHDLEDWFQAEKELTEIIRGTRRELWHTCPVTNLGSARYANRRFSFRVLSLT